jgi:hypothetical protein
MSVMEPTGVIEGQSREQASAQAADTSKRGEDPGTSEAPAPELSSVELFRELVKTAVASPSLQEEMLARIVRYGPDDLPEMIEIIDQAKRVIRAENADFIRRETSGKLPRTTSQDRERMYMIRGELIGKPYRKIEWLERVRRYLEEEREDYENERRGCTVLRFRDEQGRIDNDPLSLAVADAFARINARNPKKWVDVADRVGGLLLTIFLCTMAVVSVCGFALWWIEILANGESWI